MIERERFIPYLQKLDKTYGGKLHFDQELVDLWYEMFADCEEEGIKLAVDRCIKESEFPPTIATVMKFYKELADEREETTKLLEHEYGMMRSIWGEREDEETYNAIVRYLNNQPKKQRKVKMVELSQEAISYYHDLIAKGIQDRPTIKEYVDRLL